MPKASGSRRTPAGIGIALAGGGPAGAVYELGALRALDEALDGLDVTSADVYVGVSAGAFVAACLANGFGPAVMSRTLVQPRQGEFEFHPKMFFRPAAGEVLRRGARVPRLLVQALVDYARSPEDLSLLESLFALAQALPVGLFDNAGIREFLAGLFAGPGRTDDFRGLDGRLVVVAAELCSGRTVRFGGRGHLDVPISLAVQASTALPGLYRPVEIGGRNYVDGVLHKTVHASVALDAGADLLLCINPIVPIDACRLRETLLDRGLPSVLSQTFRTLVHSRMNVGMSAYRWRYPDATIVLIEPRSDDYDMFFTNVFSFSARRAIAARGYEDARAHLLLHADELEAPFARHGIVLRRDVLQDGSRDLWSSIGLRTDKNRVPLLTSLDRAIANAERLVERRGPAGTRPTPPRKTKKRVVEAS